MNPRYHGAAAMLSDSFEVFAAVFQRIPKESRGMIFLVRHDRLVGWHAASSRK